VDALDLSEHRPAAVDHDRPTRAAASVAPVVIDRRAVRALLIVDQSVLLIRGHDPARPEAGPWWLTPGGGIESGETIESALAREILEETGLRLVAGQLGPVVATRVAAFEFENRRYHQEETFFAMRVNAFTPSSAGWDDAEHRSLLEYRWWDIEALATTEEPVYPSELAQVLRAVLERTMSEPIELGGP
jgi:8-oxo-dGTP pyrophosphatase MutT (NUDIX family)